jgi:multidrug transporter EmrE-like cation transporter
MRSGLASAPPERSWSAIFLFGEPADVFRMSCLVLIVVGMVGLRLASTH